MNKDEILERLRGEMVFVGAAKVPKDSIDLDALADLIAMAIGSDEEEEGLKEGVVMTKNGKYYIPGKGFIKKEEAYL